MSLSLDSIQFGKRQACKVQSSIANLLNQMQTNSVFEQSHANRSNIALTHRKMCDSKVQVTIHMDFCSNWNIQSTLSRAINMRRLKLDWTFRSDEITLANRKSKSKSNSTHSGGCRCDAVRCAYTTLLSISMRSKQIRWLGCVSVCHALAFVCAPVFVYQYGALWAIE